MYHLTCIHVHFVLMDVIYNFFFQQLENSNDILNQRLEQRLQVWEEEKRELLTREDQRKSDTDTMKIKYNKQIKGTIDWIQ